MKDFAIKYTVIGLYILDIVAAVYVADEGKSIWPWFFLFAGIEIVIALAIAIFSSRDDSGLDEQPKTSDQTLENLAGSGNKDAWNELVNRYKEGKEE